MAGRGRSGVVFSLFLGLAMLWGWSLPAVAAPTTLSATASVDASYTVTAKGTVVQANGKGVRFAPVSVSIGGQQVATGTTNGGGKFTISFSLPDSLRSAPQTVEFRFDGRANLDASSATATITPLAPPQQSQPPSEPPPATTQAPPPSPTPPAKSRVVVTAELSATEANPDTLLELTGTLATQAGAPVVDAQITVVFAGEPQPDSTTYTESDGGFRTYLGIPADTAAGEATVTVQFAGAPTFEAGRLDLPLTITVDTPEPSPTTTITESTAADTTVVASEGSAASATAAPATEEEADTTPATPPSNPMPWFLATLVAVAGTALLVALVLVYRGVGRRRSEDDDDDLDLLAEPDELAPLAADEAVLNDDVGEEIEPTWLDEALAPLEDAKAARATDDTQAFEPGDLDEPPARPRRGM